MDMWCFLLPQSPDGHLGLAAPQQMLQLPGFHQMSLRVTPTRFHYSDDVTLGKVFSLGASVSSSVKLVRVPSPLTWL